MADEFVTKRELEAILANFLKMLNAKKNVSDAGGGDVVGPGAATDEAVARFDGVTGKLIQNGTFIINDAGIITAGGWQGSDINNQYVTSTVRARAYLNTQQNNIPNVTQTKVLLDAESYDTGNDFDADGVDSDFTVPVTGWYLVIGQITWTSVVADKAYWTGIGVDGTVIAWGLLHASHAYTLISQVSDIIYVTANQKITLEAYQGSGVSTVDIAAASAYTYISIHLLST